MMDNIPDSFQIVRLTPIKVDHLIRHMPECVADSRRKPVHYESLAMPYKKDRRFIHEYAIVEDKENDTSNQEWLLREINP